MRRNLYGKFHPITFIHFNRTCVQLGREVGLSIKHIIYQYNFNQHDVIEVVLSVRLDDDLRIGFL